MDQLKTQLMTIFAVRNDGSSIMQLVYSIVAITIIEQVIKFLPTAIAAISEYLQRRYAKVIKIVEKASGIKSRIVFRRFYNQRNEDNLADAILQYMCDQDCAQDLLYNDFYMANKKEIFQLCPDIHVKICEQIFSKNVLESIQFEIFSETLPLSKLKRWVDDVHKNFTIGKKNKLGDKKFFFDEIVPATILGAPQSPSLFFAMTEFFTNKSLKNIYGPNIEKVRSRIDLFINHPEWYESKGIPHTLGILLHGPPGTGKTSVIKGVARDTKRHIFNIKLREDTTCEQLTHLFYSENIKIKDENQHTQSIIVPSSHRIYVLEDVDCLTSIVLDRKYRQDGSVVEVIEEVTDDIPSQNSGMSRESIFGRQSMQNQEKNVQDRKLTLSFLLNLIDGLLETPGRILIMTSNFPERLDKALVRPGRIDINLELGYCTPETANDMFTEFYSGNLNFDFSFISGITPGITPARIQELLCGNIDDPETAFKDLKILCSEKEL